MIRKLSTLVKLVSTLVKLVSTIWYLNLSSAVWVAIICIGGMSDDWLFEMIRHWCHSYINCSDCWFVAKIIVCCDIGIQIRSETIIGDDSRCH